MTEATETPRHPAEQFSFDDWIHDANLPTESVLVYKRPDVLAELSELKRQIELEERVQTAEKTASDRSKVNGLLKEYERLLKTFSGSGLTVYLRAITDDERDELRVSHDERTKGWDPLKANAHFGYDLLSKAITHVKPAGAEKIPVSFTPQQVTDMEKAIGNAQMQVILQARHTAQNALPSADADFLQRSSGEETGQG